MSGSVFFYQAEDGIRDTSVTGVQTCALPISISEIDLSDSKVSANDKEKFLAMLRTKKDAFAKHAMDIGCVEGLTGEVCPTVDDIGYLFTKHHTK